MVGGAGYTVGKGRPERQEAKAAAPPGQIQRGPGAAPSGDGGMSQMDRLDALKKLGELHDSGVLTDEQFEAEKESLV
jgi:Short C-terminal domain